MTQKPIKLSNGVIITEYWDLRVVHKFEDLTPEQQQWLTEPDEDLFYKETLFARIQRLIWLNNKPANTTNKERN